MKFPSVLPKCLVDLIVLEFCPDALHSYLCTSLANFYSESIRTCILPSYKQRTFLRRSSLTSAACLYMACRWYSFPKKKRLSKKHLSYISYSDFKKLEHFLVENFLKRKYVKGRQRKAKPENKKVPPPA